MIFMIDDLLLCMEHSFINTVSTAVSPSIHTLFLTFCMSLEDKIDCL